MNIEKIGEFPSEVIDVLKLDIPKGTAIYIGDSNIEHMRSTHPRDFGKYYSRLSRILSEPDYVGINSKDKSIEIIKVFSKYIKVAVRISNDGDYYVRSLYEVGKSRIENSLKNGQLKHLTKQ